jgi:hypothetical protein
VFLHMCGRVPSARDALSRVKTILSNTVAVDSFGRYLYKVLASVSTNAVRLSTQRDLNTLVNLVVPSAKRWGPSTDSIID